MGTTRNVHGTSVENLKGRDHLEDLSVNANIILKWIIRKWNRRECTGYIWLRIWTSVRLL
jgi:hypothetical protein